MAKRVRSRLSATPPPVPQPVGAVPAVPAEALDQSKNPGVALFPEHNFNSWDEFKASFTEKLFPGGSFLRGKYLFRGHSDPKWFLTSTFDRMFATQGMERRPLIAAELLAAFKRALEGFEIPESARVNDSLLLALGQHYGLPTRMLDWTESPYVAAFFAYNRSAIWGAHDHQIVIWVLDTTNPIWSGHYGVEIIDVPSFGNKRLRNQAGKFTLAKTPFSTLEDYAKAHGDFGKTSLMKFLIPASEARNALSDLDAMGIHHATVYPEIEGSAQMALFRTVALFQAFVETQSSPRPT